MSKPVRFVRKLCACMVLVVSAIAVSANSYAIDNPDSPDYVALFHARASKYESAVSDTAGNNSDFSEAARRYDTFLDIELNTAYRELQGKLSDAQRVELQDSQKTWLRYRDDESKFIDANWSRQNFGSSSLISRHMYKASIVRNRVEQLLSYLKNY